jgi:multiple sugar transport system substrate-binding protein
MGWQVAAGYRWLPFLYQHGGQLLDAELRNPEINSPKGVETIAWTQSWFKEGLVPPSTYVKSTEQTQNLFANGTIGLLLGGDWQIPFLTRNMTKWAWGVTYMPRDVAMASDLGGNCLAVSRDSKSPEVAADFLKFITNAENMREFITSAQFLPVRKSLMAEQLNYALRPEAMRVYIEQSGTIPPHLVKTVTLPVFSKINASLNDELDLAFTSGQDPKATAANIEAATRTALG